MQMFQTQIKALSGRIIDTILPPRCVVTGDLVDRQGMISPQAWVSLDFVTAPFCEKCGTPFEIEVDPGSFCASCLDRLPAFETARAALKYNDASRDMILGFKHADRLYAVKAFVPWLKRAGEEMLEEADVIVPVPLHYWRMISRRYNQSALIAQALARATGHECILDALLRTRATATQGHMSAKARFKNVYKAFAVSPKWAKALKGKTVILVDDVYTTGATVQECTKALLKADAAKVHVLTLARVAYED